MTRWGTTRLGDIADFRNGLNYTDADLGEGLAVIGVSDFQDNVTAGLGALSQLNMSALSKGDALVQQGDILFVRSNGNRELIGRSLYLKDKPQIPTSHSGFTIRCRFRDARSYPRFYAYLFRGPLIRQILSAQGGGTNISNLNQGILAQLEVPLPRLQVQERIATILSAYDDLIENNTRRIAILEEMARRIFEEWFVHFRAPGCEGLPMVESAVGPVPQGWEVATLESLCSRITDGAHNSPPSVDHGLPMLSVKDMRNWGFDFSESRSISQADFDDLVRNDCRPLSGDILIAKDGANLNKHTFLIDAVILSSIAILRPNPSVEKEFIVATLKSDDVSKRIKNSRSGAAIPRIILKDFRRLPVILPPRVTPKRGESEKSLLDRKGLCLVDFWRRRATNQNQGWDGSSCRSRGVDRLAETPDRGASG